MEDKKKAVQNRKKKKKKFKAWKVVLLVLILIMLIIIGAVGGIAFAFIKTSPEINVDTFMDDLAQSTTIYDKDGNQIKSLHGEENRKYATLPNISKHTQDAFIAIEDERFRQHNGVDVKRMFGAVWADLKTRSYDQGASTITQQLIKKRVLTDDKKMRRKVQEIYLALQVEKVLSKDQILEYYLNTIYLGGPAYGVQAAAEYYFNKDASQLSIAESAFIAGLTHKPSYYNPYSEDEEIRDRYKSRQATVLSKMLELNMINPEEYEKAKNEKLVFQKKYDTTQIKYQWFIEAALDSVREDLRTKYRYTDDELNQKLYSGGLKIYTTLDPNIQDIVEKVANDDKYYPTLKKDISTWGKDKTIQPQIGIVIMDYRTGEVKGVVGGRGNQPQRSQNRATDKRFARQPGSSMKPLAVYGPAMDLGYAPASVVDDSPLSPDQKAMAKGWDPKNFTRGRYDGFVTIRDAVRRSLNTVAAKLMLEIGVNTSVDYIQKFGISTLITTPDKNGVTDMVYPIALGGLGKGVTPLEMSAAYGVFANGGVYTEPILYTKVLDNNDNVLLEKKPEKRQAISPQAAYLVTDMLKGAVNNGTGGNARIGSMPAAGKTGTTNEQADAYFAGYTPYYSGAVWMGHDKPSIGIVAGENSNRGLTSGETAQMWGDIMRAIHKNLKVASFKKPDRIVSASVCNDSGKLPTELCQRDQRGSRIVTDIFAAGTVPTDHCNVHTTALIDTSTGKIANQFCPSELVKELVFIKKPSPVDSRVRDFKYLVPTDACTAHNRGSIIPTPEPSDPEIEPTPTPDPDEPEAEPTPTPTPAPTPTPPGDVTPTPTPKPKKDKDKR
jgi:penicillin-binding protein 1A